MKAWLRIASAAAVLLAVFSCVSTGVKEAAKPELTSRLETGKSTKAEVAALLGDPAIVTYGAQGDETWNYYYVTEFPAPGDFIPVLDALGPFFYQNTRVLTFAYNRKGVLQKLQRTRLTGSAEVYPY
jgi:outer membrane protein assembly factor BamE (lipoprotein component of BamABCDE complex)